MSSDPIYVLDFPEQPHGFGDGDSDALDELLAFFRSTTAPPLRGRRRRTLNSRSRSDQAGRSLYSGRWRTPAQIEAIRAQAREHKRQVRRWRTRSGPAAGGAA